jgi:hypothetical protein
MASSGEQGVTAKEVVAQSISQVRTGIRLLGCATGIE